MTRYHHGSHNGQAISTVRQGGRREIYLGDQRVGELVQVNRHLVKTPDGRYGDRIGATIRHWIERGMPVWP